MTDDKDPPNLGLLIKLMKMTSSSHDGEALSAMRMANAQLSKFGGCWEALLKGRVTVIGDPFESLGERPQRATPPPPPRTPPAPPPPPRDWAKTAPPNPTYAPNPKPRKPKPQPARSAPASPTPSFANLSFAKDTNGEWRIKSPIDLNVGETHSVTTRNGALRAVVIGREIEKNKWGDTLYAFVNATLSDLA